MVFYALGLAGAHGEPVRLEVVKPLAIGAASGSQGTASVNPWFKVVRSPEVNITAIKVKLENIDGLEQYFRYLILVIREAAEFTGEGSYTDSQSYNLTQPVYARMVSASSKDEVIADAIRDSVVSQGLPELGYTADGVAQDLVNRVAKIYLVIYNDMCSRMFLIGLSTGGTIRISEW